MSYNLGQYPVVGLTKSSGNNSAWKTNSVLIIKSSHSIHISVNQLKGYMQQRLSPFEATIWIDFQIRFKIHSYQISFELKLQRKYLQNSNEHLRSL